jgi:hypothetical protein
MNPNQILHGCRRNPDHLVDFGCSPLNLGAGTARLLRTSVFIASSGLGAWVMFDEHRHRDMCAAEIVIRCGRGGKAEALVKAPN